MNDDPVPRDIASPSADALLRLAPADWPTLAAFIHRHNRVHDGVRCLHAEQGETIEQHAQELAELARLPDGEAAFWCLRDAGSGETLAMIGCEMDPALRRAWLRGPLLAQPDDEALARRLVEHLQAALAPAIGCFDAFPAEADAPLNQLYRGAGYRVMGVYRVMQAALADAAPPHRAAGAAVVRRATAADLATLLALHHPLFPSSYLKDSDFDAALAADDRRVLVAELGGAVTGYLHAKDDAAEDEVYVDYLGVAQAARGRGLGGALLRAALAWGHERGRRKASLTVREDRAPALRLYEGVGFRQIRAGVHWRLGD